MAVRTFVGGIHPAQCKYACDAGTVTAPVPARVTVPVGPSWVGYKVLAPKGTEVKVGQKLADNEGFMCVPTHSPVSGKVVDAKPYRAHTGLEFLGITIESDGKQELCEGIAPVEDLDSMTPEEIRNVIREAGMLGMGGAEFPTHVKLSLPQGVKVDTVVVNGGECEPYLTSDHRMMTEKADKVVHGTYIVMRSVGVKRAVIGVEDNKPDAIAMLTAAAGKYQGIEVMPLKSSYPQGYEKAIIKATLGREVPPGALPFSVGVVVVNVGTAAAISDRFTTGLPLIKRYVTVSGEAVSRPATVEAYIGTYASELVELCGGVKGELGKAIFGGPMMGVAVPSLDFPITKGTSGIVLLGRQQALFWKEMPCIRCGRCNEVCPMFLQPSEIHKYALAEDMARAEKLFAADCMECGCCSYVCPSKRPLVQSIKLAKQYALARRKK